MELFPLLHGKLMVPTNVQLKPSQHKGVHAFALQGPGGTEGEGCARNSIEEKAAEGQRLLVSSL